MNVGDALDGAKRDIAKEVRKLIAKTPMNEQELSEALSVGIGIIHKTIAELAESGANLVKDVHERYLLHSVVEQGGRLVLKPVDRGDGWTAFGFLTDRHHANRHCRLDVIQEAYRYFSSEGVKDVLDAGNCIDGEARFNKSELLAFGMDRQIDLFIDQTPLVHGIRTHFITGDDHEGWYSQRESINIGQYIQMKADKAGRTDLNYLGHVEADVELRVGKGRMPVMRVMHPGGGASYAFSYAPQKLVESFQGGEKPAVLLVGHYHKFDYCYPREVHVVSGGTGEDQTMFMRKLKLAAHVGFSIVKIKQDKSDGHITSLQVEWHPFYDRGFYGRGYDI